ncbi:MAG: tetratricopeptide repeat protein [Mucilaginibacter polytrichastri]|nr:tetratricopeptide repeat protein [Mucilaginibacter polytrichastri]
MPGVYKRTLFLACLLLGLAGTAFAQRKLVDSLKNLAEAHRNDTAGVELFRQLSFRIQPTRPDSALIYAQEGLNLARKFSMKRGEADCMNRLGVVLWKNGKYDRALLFLLQSLKIREEINDLLGMLKSLSDIGIVYSDQGENRTALTYHFRARAIALELQEKRRLGIILSNIGNCYSKLNNIDSALNYTMEAYGTQQSIRDSLTLPNTLSILGDIHYKMHHTGLAMSFYRAGVDYARKSNDESSLADSYNSIARLYSDTNKPDSSIHFALLAMEAAGKAMYPEGIYNASSLLTGLYHGRNEHLELKYLKTAVSAKDSLFNAEKIRQIQTLSFNEAARQEEMAEEKYRAQAERLANLQLIGIAVFIPFFFLMVLLLSRSRTHRRVIDFMSVLSLLLAFEFITLLSHPFVQRIGNHSPLLELIMLVILASVMVPLHHRITRWMKDKLAHDALRRTDKHPGHTHDKHAEEAVLQTDPPAAT